MKHHHGFETRCVHTGNLEDKVYNSAVSPIYTSSAYGFLDQKIGRYPRYFTTPNQIGLAQKIASLENAEEGLILSSGMAAITAILFSHLQAGDHLVVQQDLYGGSTNLIRDEFSKYNIDYTFVSSFDLLAFEKAIKPNTKGIFIETPSNPLLKIIDIKSIARISKKYGLWSLIDNTFASPVNQNPIDYGIDIVMHSATKYLGGHSDLCAGILLGTHERISKIRDFAKNFGASLADNTVWLLERSIKTLSLRVGKQTNNAQQLAEYLTQQKWVIRVYYPGLTTHIGHALAKKQMKGYGAMLSFDLDKNINLKTFFKSLRIIKPVVSLGGVESGVSSPKMTSHILLTDDERKQQGIGDQLVRFSMGIENLEDLKSDLHQAIEKARL
ncbi:MAG: PLP-dependent aspartate aminotransferase family protein [Flavobacteriaceae bacterium]|nr:PLP-dependent aspartate aminotransferase family protein [Flavobacteriaceae bacterium]MCY4267975.1 PLP-dependent aspartate aminotransferase family protein [Flavobacteriaceae bacterium]